MKRMGHIFLTLIFLLPGLFVSTARVQANDTVPPTIKYEKINMENGFPYLIKRGKEKVAIVLLSYNPQKKLSYYEKLLDIRLAELKYIVDHRDIANIQVASQRYFSTAGQLTSYFLSKPNLLSQKGAVIGLFSNHSIVLEKLKASYENTTAEWRLLRDDINYLADYSKMIK